MTHGINFTHAYTRPIASSSRDQNENWFLLFIHTDSGAIRLVGKNGATSRYLTAGRVDIFYVGRWGTICNDGFSSSDAAALCHILTGSSAVLAYGPVGNSGLQ